jgi:hypothetical protein
MQQELRDRLPFFKRELFQVRAEQLAQGLSMLHHLLPMDALMPRVRSLPSFLLKLLQVPREFLAPRLQLTEVHNLGLVGIQQALVLPLAPLASLGQLRLLRLKRGEVLPFGVRPGLRPLRDHRGIASPLAERVPDHLIESVSPHALGLAACQTATTQRRAAFALVGEVLVFLTHPVLPDAHHPESTRTTLDACAQPIPPGRGLVHLARRGRIALQWQLRFLKQCARDDGWRFAQDPFAGRPVASPRLEMTELVFCRLAILWDDGLAISIAGLTSIMYPENWTGD